MMMFKVLAVVAVAASVVLATPPVLQSMRKLKSEYNEVQLQRCTSGSCASGSCSTVIDVKTNQCHNHPGFLEHGRIVRCSDVSRQRSCFRETIYDARGGQGCNGKVIMSQPRELNQCYEESILSGRFYKFTGSGKAGNMTMNRDCDWGCNNCGVIIPVTQGTCMAPKHARFFDFAFENGPSFQCGGSGWTEITVENFFSPACDGQPDFVNSGWSDMCYNFFGHGHKFNCA